MQDFTNAALRIAWAVPCGNPVLIIDWGSAVFIVRSRRESQDCKISDGELPEEKRRCNNHNDEHKNLGGERRRFESRVRFYSHHTGSQGFMTRGLLVG
jgi:hypothetical protein